MTQQSKAKQITLIAMLSALAYVAVVATRMLPPMILFLKYDPKDVVIVLGGLILGPMSSVIISVISSLAEMLTVSETGIWGFVMNVISSCAFAVPAALIYKRNRSIKGAVIGLGLGVITMTIVMMGWNYLIVPIYQGWPRDMVAGMLIPYFMPFNLIKGSINMVLTMFLYKPLITTLRKARIIQSPETQSRIEIGVGIKALILVLMGACLLAEIVLMIMGSL